MEQTKTILKKTWVVAALACVCCLLWGSAIPLIKTGYRLMQMDSADTASQIVFAGVRFALAGILVLIFASLRERKVLLPDRTVLKYAVPVCMAQTVCQYFFFYIGVAHTSGVKGAIITGLGNFIAILLSCLVFHKEKMTGRKMLGCILGFAGVVVINLMGNSLDAGFRLTGEGFILIAQFSYGMSTVLINIFSRKVSPVVLSGTQFTMGGIILFLIGKGMGGHFGVVNAAGIGIIFYLAMVSAVAYTLWSVLLAWNDVLYRVWKDEHLKKQLRNLILIFTDKILDHRTYHLNLFFNEDWESKYRIISYGHDIEASWLLHEAAIELGDNEILQKVEPLVQKVAIAAEDGLLANGSLIYEYHPNEKKADTDLHWWVQAENVVGHFNLYQHFGDEPALGTAYTCWKFIQRYLIDKEQGEWHWSVSLDHEINREDDKAGFWKCPYHNGRMCMEIIERLAGE